MALLNKFLQIFLNLIVSMSYLSNVILTCAFSFFWMKHKAHCWPLWWNSSICYMSDELKTYIDRVLELLKKNWKENFETCLVMSILIVIQRFFYTSSHMYVCIHVYMRKCLNIWSACHLWKWIHYSHERQVFIQIVTE
jgi:hypothetical protein